MKFLWWPFNSHFASNDLCVYIFDLAKHSSLAFRDSYSFILSLSERSKGEKKRRDDDFNSFSRKTLTKWTQRRKKRTEIVKQDHCLNDLFRRFPPQHFTLSFHFLLFFFLFFFLCFCILFDSRFAVKSFSYVYSARFWFLFVCSRSFVFFYLLSLRLFLFLYIFLFFSLPFDFFFIFLFSLTDSWTELQAH